MNVFDITAIEEEVIAIVRNLGVSKKVYDSRPKVAEPATDFVVVHVRGTNDLAAYGECVISIDLFAKDIEHTKNKKKLSVMYNKLCKGFALKFTVNDNIIAVVSCAKHPCLCNIVKV